MVNALSARLDVEVDRSGNTHAISFRRGVPGSFASAGPDAAFEPGGLRKTKRIPKTRTGTRVRYWADRQIFLKDAKLSLDNLHQRARQTAFLVPGLTIVVRDEYGLGEGGSKGRSPSASTAASASSVSTWRATSPSVTSCACRARAPSRRRCPSWTTTAR